MGVNDTKYGAEGNGASDRTTLMKFGAILFLGFLINYAKFLWPLIFGRMHGEGIPFVAAVQDASLHVLAFIALVASWPGAALWIQIHGKQTNSSVRLRLHERSHTWTY